MQPHQRSHNPCLRNLSLSYPATRSRLPAHKWYNQGPWASTCFELGRRHLQWYGIGMAESPATPTPTGHASPLLPAACVKQRVFPHAWHASTDCLQCGPTKKGQLLPTMYPHRSPNSSPGQRSKAPQYSIPLFSVVVPTCPAHDRPKVARRGAWPLAQAHYHHPWRTVTCGMNVAAPREADMNWARPQPKNRSRI